MRIQVAMADTCVMKRCNEVGDDDDERGREVRSMEGERKRVYTSQAVGHGIGDCDHSGERERTDDGVALLASR